MGEKIADPFLGIRALASFAFLVALKKEIFFFHAKNSKFKIQEEREDGKNKQERGIMAGTED